MRLFMARVWPKPIAMLAGALASLLVTATAATAGDCGSGAGDATAVAALVEQAREACPCGSFDGRQAFRDCVRGVVGDAIGGSTRVTATAAAFRTRSASDAA